MTRKYPAKLFVIGVIINFIFHYFYFFLLGSILCVVGIWNQICLCLGIAMLCLDLVFSISDQIRIRKASLTASDNPEFNKLMDIFLGSNDPDAFKKFMEEKMHHADGSTDDKRS